MKMFFSLVFIVLCFSPSAYFSLVSPEIGSLVNISEEENNPIIGAGIGHGYHQ